MKQLLLVYDNKNQKLYIIKEIALNKPFKDSLMSYYHVYNNFKFADVYYFFTLPKTKVTLHILKNVQFKNNEV